MSDDPEAETVEESEEPEETEEVEESEDTGGAEESEETGDAEEADKVEESAGESEADEEGEEEEGGIQEGDFIRLGYTARTTDDDLLVDTTDESVAEDEGVDTSERTIQPRVITLGAGHLFEAVEEDIYGKEVGEEGSVVVPDEEAFGEHDPDQVRTVSTDKIPEDNRYPGGSVEIDGEHGHIETIIGGRSRVDFNHPLAGKDIEYEYEILDVVEDRLERARGILSTVVDADLEMWIEVDEEEEEVVIEPDEEEAEEDEAESEEVDEAEPETETRTVEYETLYIESSPQLAFNQQWMFQKHQIAQDLIDRIDVDRVIVQEILDGGFGMGGMGGLGGLGGDVDLEEELDDLDADVDAEELVEELEGGEE